MTFDRWFALLGALFGFLGVAAGAFGAHALRDRLSPDLAAVFETAVRYHLVHAIALLAVAALAGRWPATGWAWSGWLFVAGIVIFSGSLYVLALSGVRAWGAVTPVGGVVLLAGWLVLTWTIAFGTQ